MGFGSSKQKSNNQSQSTSQSLNQAFPFLQGALGGQVGQAQEGNNAIRSLLGLSGAPAQTDAFNKFRESSGYNFIKDEGVSAINNSMASKGLLNSGSALKAITGYSSQLANKFLDSYLAQLTGITDNGYKAAQILSGAGNTANSQSNSVGSSTGKSSNFAFG